MKLLKWITLLVVAGMINCCCIPFPHFKHHQSFYYILDLIFLDEQGNDLVKGIAYEWEGINQGVTEDDNLSGFTVKKSEFSVNIKKNIDSEYVKENPMTIFLIRDNGNYRLRFFLYGSTAHPKDPEVFILELRCPYLFDDAGLFNAPNGKYHEIVTLWKPIMKKNLEYSCYFIEFEGKEITSILYELGPPTLPTESMPKVSKAKIVLDR